MSWLSLTMWWTAERPDPDSPSMLRGHVYLGDIRPDCLLYVSPTLQSREDAVALRAEFAAAMRERLQ